MSKHCGTGKKEKEECLTREYIKVRKNCVKNLYAKDAKIDNLTAKNLSINGNSLNCMLSAPPVTYNTNRLVLLGDTGSTGPSGVTGPANVDPVVFQALIQNTRQNRQDLQARLAAGRNFINDFLISRGCPLSCPAPRDTPVPLEIYGILTLPIYNNVRCGMTGASGEVTKVNTAVDFNLQITYLLEVTHSIEARNLSVLIQVGYLDSTGNVIIEEVFISNKQLYPTLDTIYGENFANIIQIPTRLLSEAVRNSPNENRQGAIQMVIYKEQGLCIWTPAPTGFQCLQETTTNAPALVESQRLFEALQVQDTLNFVSITPSQGRPGDTVTIAYEPSGNTLPGSSFFITGVIFGETRLEVTNGCPVDTPVPCTFPLTVPPGTGVVNVILIGSGVNVVQSSPLPFTYL